MLLTLNLKTASGTNLEGARFTDSPGYFFDFSTGRDFRLAQNLFLRPSAMTGFYSYQTNLDDYLQNDAVMYGLGLDLFSDKFKFRSALTGYAGYINNGDKPLVFRLTLRTMQNKSFQMKLFFEHGIHDFPYTTFKISTVFVLHKSEYFWFDKKSE